MRLFLNQHSKYSAFTLLEMLIVASIIIVLSVIVLANYEQGGHQFALQRSAHKLAQDLRKVEEMAMSAEEFDCGPSLGIIVPPGGYGIHFNRLTATTSYILFADCIKNNSYDGVSEKIEKIELEEGIEITSPDFLTINFVPPDPIVVGGSVTIILTGKTQSAEITVNSIGLIEIQ